MEDMRTVLVHIDSVDLLRIDIPADVAALQNDVAGIDGQLSVATSTTYVQEAVTEAVDELVDLETLEF